MKIIVLIMLIAFSASAQHDEVDGYIDLSVVQEVIVNGSDVSGAVSSLKGIVPQILSVQKNKGGSQTVDCSGVLIATDIVLKKSKIRFPYLCNLGSMLTSHIPSFAIHCFLKFLFYLLVKVIRFLDSMISPWCSCSVM